MRALQPKPHLQVSKRPQQPISPLETVRYATDMLENLRRMAAGQGLGLLAHLLELAQTEARMIARDQTQDQVQSLTADSLEARRG